MKLLYLNEGKLIQEISYSSRSFQQRPPSLSPPSSGDQRQHRSDHLLPTASSHNRSNSNDSHRSGSEIRHHSSNSRSRFNPTAYIRERNLKLRQIEIQKSRESRRGSESDMSDFSARDGNKEFGFFIYLILSIVLLNLTSDLAQNILNLEVFSIHRVNTSVTPVNIAKTFSIETIYYERLVGIHRFSSRCDFHSKIAETCPEAMMVLPNGGY